MFTDIKLYNNDVKKFYEDLKKIEDEYLPDAPERESKIKDINDKFRDKIRKYLPTCLNIINTNFNCKYSLYKVGKDYNAAFKVIETNVKKTKEEVESELNNFKGSIDMNSLSQSVQSEINLACEILITYVDDGSKPKYSNEFLQASEPVASSIITNTPVMSQESVEQKMSEDTSIQYNPYANQPIEFESDNNFVSDNDKPLIDVNSFNANQINNGSQAISSTNNITSIDSEYANNDLIDVNSLSIFGGSNSNK